MESIIAAIITAIGSIVAAIIQVSAAYRNNREPQQIVEQKTKHGIESTRSRASSMRTNTPDPLFVILKANVKKWSLSVAVISIAIIGLGALHDGFAVLGMVFVIVWSIVYAYKSPITWGLAAVFVGLLYGSTLLGYWVGEGYISDGDKYITPLVYTINVVVVSFLSSYRLSKSGAR